MRRKKAETLRRRGEISVRKSRLLYLKWITNRDLLYSTWKSAQCYVGSLLSVMWQPGWEGSLRGRLDACISMAESLRCSPETITLLIIYVCVLSCLHHVGLFATLWATAYQASLPFTISQGRLKLISIELVIFLDSGKLPTLTIEEMQNKHTQTLRRLAKTQNGKTSMHFINLETEAYCIRVDFLSLHS